MSKRIDLDALIAQSTRRVAARQGAKKDSGGLRKPPKSPAFVFPIKPNEYDRVNCMFRSRNPCDKAAALFGRVTTRWLQGVVGTIVGQGHALTATSLQTRSVYTTRHSDDDAVRAWIPPKKQAVAVVQHLKVYPKERNDQWGDPYVSIYVAGTDQQHRGWIRWGMTAPEYPSSATGTVDGQVRVSTRGGTMSDWLRQATDESAIELRDWLVEYAQRARL